MIFTLTRWYLMSIDSDVVDKAINFVLGVPLDSSNEI